MINKHIADDGFLFDWKEPRYNYKNKKIVREHLYVSVLFLGANDSIDNYIQVKKELSLNYYKE